MPAQAGIQYAAARRFYHRRLRLLGPRSPQASEATPFFERLQASEATPFFERLGAGTTLSV
jgi:hypothetical protein